MESFSTFQSQYDLPPLRGYTFLGTEASADKPIVSFDGTTEGWFDPAAHVPWIKQAIAAESFAVELVDGYLPALRYTYRNPASAATCEMISFAADRAPLGAICIYVRLAETGSSKPHRIRHFSLRDEARIGASQFDDHLRNLRSRWHRFFDEAAIPPSDDLTMLNACKASIIRALITFTGKHPHYGVRRYGEVIHDGFAPTIMSLVNCLIDWGHAALARDYLLYYFERFVTDSGRFDYYGASLAEYGQMLSLVRKLAGAGSGEWLDAIQPKLEAMRGWLWSQQSSSPTGLMAGVPEADTRDEVDIYFHNNAWCWRGLLDLSRVFPRHGDEARCDAYRATILDAVAAVTDRSSSPAFIPPVSRKMAPFETMTQDRFASYTNYRYWPELLSSGILSKRQMLTIVDYRAAHRGEVSGMTRFLDHADNWPMAEYGSALLRLGRVRELEHLLLSHLAGHMVSETWTAYEQVGLVGERFREPRADYCVPAQLVAPRLLAWLGRKARRTRASATESP
jgi:hypothetical protein